MGTSVLKLVTVVMSCAHLAGDKLFHSIKKNLCFFTVLCWLINKQSHGFKLNRGASRKKKTHSVMSMSGNGREIFSIRIQI